MKKKILFSLAATLIMVAGFATEADAQRGRGGPGVMRAGGGPVVGGGGGFRRAGFVGGPRFVGGHRFVGHRFVGHHRFVHHRFGHRRFARFAIAGGFVGAYPYYAYGGCRRWRIVPTPWGPQWRLVNVCSPYHYGPYAYGYGAYPGGFYRAVW